MVTVIFAFWCVCLLFWWPVFMWLLAAQPVSKFKEFVVYLQLMNDITVQVSP
jgi:hypothetical protein